MAINIDMAAGQASDMTEYAAQLKSIKRQLLSYRDMLVRNWQGKEVSYITRSIDKALNQLDNLTLLLKQAGKLININAELLGEEMRTEYEGTEKGGGSR